MLDLPDLGDIPEHLPGEPQLPVRSDASTAWTIFTQLLGLVVSSLLMLPLWPLYLIARLVLPRPPHLAPFERLLHLLSLIATEQPPAPGLPGRQRLLIALFVLRRWSLTPLWGLAWYLDEMLYDQELKAIVIRAPLFEISAARSGSTQIAHYLEDDPQIVAPAAMHTEFPYLWLWRIVDFAIGRLISPESLRAFAAGLYPSTFLERHELDPFRTDTFEMQFLHSQLTGIAMSLGPRAMVAEMNNARVTPETQTLWRQDFLSFIDGIGRKRLLLAQLRHRSETAPESPMPPVHLMIKGHFLNVAPELAQRYPDARFLTVVRAPHKRLQSIINFHRVQPLPPGVDPPRWSWLARESLEIEIDYCEREMAWFEQPEGPRRTVVRFDDYVRDLAGTMQHIYRDCLDQNEPSPHVPRSHAERERSNYTIDRSLAQLGIDSAWLAQRLEPYIAWCRSRNS